MPKKRKARDLAEPGVGEPFGPEVSAFRYSVAKWLRRAMLDHDGKAKLNHSEIIKESGIGRSSYYRILRGETDAEPDTLLRLAAALRVPPPEVERVLRLDQPGTPFALAPLAKIKEAMTLLQEAAAAMEATPAATEAAARHAHRVVEKLRPSQPRGKSA
jgi:transcriptional regulator with XRE-family HTH domain